MVIVVERCLPGRKKKGKESEISIWLCQNNGRKIKTKLQINWA